MANTAPHHADPVAASSPDFDAELDRALNDLRASVAKDSLPEMALRLAEARLRQRTAIHDEPGLLDRPPAFL